LVACKKPISEKDLKTQVHLPAELFKKSKTLLLEKKWLEALSLDDTAVVLYVITDKGTVFMDKYNKLQELLTSESEEKQVVTVKAAKK
jgi:predicted transcriptional regulator